MQCKLKTIKTMLLLEYRNEGERVNTFASTSVDKLIKKMKDFYEAMGYDNDYINDIANTLLKTGNVADEENDDEWTLYRAQEV